MSLTRPLPGVVFSAAPPPVDPLPRMDVAAFVGFAARGPLHAPVVVEDPAQFRDVFGDAPLLAWDPAAGAWQTACLAAAVRDFFAQGGQRCWVIRVAGRDARANTFPVAGVLRAAHGALTPAQARCVGSWSDSLRAGASLLVAPLRCLNGAEVTPGTRLALPLGVVRGDDLRAGDLVQLDFEGGARLYLRVEQAAPVAPPPADGGRWQAVEGAVFGFRRLAEDAVLVGQVQDEAGKALPARLHGATLRLESENLDPAPGAWLTFTPAAGEGRLWLLAAGGDQLKCAWWEGVGGAPLALSAASRVTMALEVRDDAQLRTSLHDLAFSAPHPRSWGRLPDDETLYGASGALDPTLRAEVASPRFPLAGPVDTDGVFIPLGLAALPVAWRGRTADDTPALVREGLVPPGKPHMLLTGADWAAFIETLYVDAGLSRFRGEALLTEAFDRRFVSAGQPLTGLHAALPLEEVSLLALPDAAHRGWRLVTQPHRAPPAPQPEPDAESPARPCPGHDLFRSTSADAAPAEAHTAETTAAPVLDDTPPPTRWELLPEDDYETAGLLYVHEQAVEMAAARADLVAVLTLPAHFRARDALDYRRTLGRRFEGRRGVASYAALYYPWLVARQADGALHRHGPEGGVCGVIAARTLARGAWVPPANEVIRDALALTLRLDPGEHLDLYNAAVNLIVEKPRGFVLWGADTLSDEPDLAPLNVRRLLILLRRLALREGQEYVFEPHSPNFRRQVALRFERRLAALFARGAFAGATPAEAYRVAVDETVNAPAGVEAGRFVVELRVAPSQPLTFIVVRLIQSGARTSAVQEA